MDLIFGDKLKTNLTLESANEQMIELFLPNIILLAIYMLTGIIGNSIVIYIYLQKMDNSCDNRFFIPCLAAGDMLACIINGTSAISMLLYHLNFTNVVLCKLMWYCMTWSACGASLILVFIAFHRYQRICKPTNQRGFMEKKGRILLFLYIGAIVVSSPVIYTAGISKHAAADLDIQNMINVSNNLTQSDTSKLAIATTVLDLDLWNASINSTRPDDLQTSMFNNMTENITAKPEKTTRNFMYHDKPYEANLTLCICERVSSDLRSGWNLYVIYIYTAFEALLVTGLASTLTMLYTKVGWVLYKHFKLMLRKKTVLKHGMESNFSKITELDSTGEPMSNSMSNPATNQSTTRTLKRTQTFKRRLKKKQTFHRKNNYTYIFIAISGVCITTYTPRLLLMMLETYDANFWLNFYDNMHVLRFLRVLNRLYIVNNIANPFLYAMFDQVFKSHLVSLLKCKQ